MRRRPITRRPNLPRFAADAPSRVKAPVDLFLSPCDRGRFRQLRVAELMDLQLLCALAPSLWGRRKTMNSDRVAIPTLVRIKTGALGRMGIYLSRLGHRRVAVFQSAGLLDDISSRMRLGLLSASIEPVAWVNVAANEFGRAISYFTDLPRSVT